MSHWSPATGRSRRERDSWLCVPASRRVCLVRNGPEAARRRGRSQGANSTPMLCSPTPCRSLPPSPSARRVQASPSSPPPPPPPNPHRLARLDLGDVRPEEQRHRPVEHDPEPPVPAGHLQQVVGPPDPPRRKAGEPQPTPGPPPASAQRRPSCRASGRRRGRRAAVDARRQRCRHLAGLADRVLRQRRIRLAVRRRDRGAVAQRPDVGMAGAPHAGIHRDPALAVVRHRNARRHRVGTIPAASTMVPASIGPSARWTRPARSSAPRARPDVGPAPLRAPGSRPRRAPDPPRAGSAARLEQVEPELVAPEPRVVAQHVLGERRQLAQQLDAHQPPPMTRKVRLRRRTSGSVAASARSNCSITWFRSSSASAMRLKVNAVGDPGMRPRWWWHRAPR